ncbi:cytochrome P450 [Thermoleptolyngbya sp. M55_K2018_002]|uniref:cytochrome P450 n=1 Tax=Thermoleptolyngbya sp. M55_K2018_002 TaxID=2747808 RepID=UPI0019F0C1FC|nr:cytochrome P450 [Thermoleptolyngbya sp. M55_K2018_002]HIK40674.1 cytochrome P450 [Thermoleptolyngbya sp. M55_K2018_002]
MHTLPPGTFGLPFLGETLNFFTDPNFAQKRHEQYGDLFKTRLLGKPTIFMRGVEANQFVLSNENTYFSVDWPPSTKALLGKLSLALQTGHEHQSRRKLLAQAFMPRALSGYISTMEAITQRYTQRWQQQGQLTWYPELRNYTLDIACKLLVGLDKGSQTRLGHVFETWCQGLFSIPLNVPWTAFGKAKRARRLLLEEMEQIVRDRQQRLSESLNSSDGPESDGSEASDALDLLIRARDEDGQGLSLEELKDQVLLLLFAGHETLTSAIASFCLLTAQSPDVLDKLRVEQRGFDPAAPLSLDLLKQMTYLEQVLREVLRRIPPVGGGFRTVLQDCAYGGYTIPKNWSVLYQIGPTHQDASLYPQPEQFDPERFSAAQLGDRSADQQRYGYVPFGGGIRECLGKEFARLEMKIFATHLLRHWQWTLLPDQDLSMVIVPTPHPRDGLRVAFAAREAG